MRNKNKIVNDFTKGDITQQLLQFMLPFFFANLLASLYNTVDTIVIGQFMGKTGISALSVGGKMMNLFTRMSANFAAGAQILISQQIGANKKEQVSSTVGTLFTCMSVFAIASSLFCICFAKQLMQMMNTPEEAFNDAVIYCVITSSGYLLLFGYNAVSTVLRGMGDSKHPLVFVAIASILNLVLDILFVAVFHWGVAGAAIATVIGQGTSLIISIVLLYRQREDFGFDFKLKSFAVHLDRLNVIIKIGLPMVAQTFFIQATQLYISSLVNVLGVTQSAAFGVGDKIVNFGTIMNQSIKQAGGAIAGQNIGAQKYDRVQKTVRCSLTITLSIAGIIAFVALTIPERIFGLFTQDADVLAYAQSFMGISIIIFTLAALAGAFETVTTGTGNSKLMFLGGFLDGVVFRLAFSLLFGKFLNMGAVGYFFGNSLARLGPALVHSIYYLSGAWKKHKRLVS